MYRLDDHAGQHSTLARRSPRQAVEWARFDQSAGHALPFSYPIVFSPMVTDYLGLYYLSCSNR